MNSSVCVDVVSYSDYLRLGSQCLLVFGLTPTGSVVPSTLGHDSLVRYLLLGLCDKRYLHAYEFGFYADIFALVTGPKDVQSHQAP